MKLVMVIAPYSSTSLQLREDVTRTAEAAALVMWENGIATICPHLNSGGFSDHLGTDPVIYRAGYVEIAKRCDAGFLILGSRKAPGATEEAATFKERGKPVFTDIKKVLAWNKK